MRSGEPTATPRTSGRRGKALVAVGVAVAALVIAVGVVLVVTHTSRRPAAASTHPSPTSGAAPQLTEPQAQQLTKDVTSNDPARVSSAVALPAGQTLDQDTIASLAGLQDLTLDPATFTSTGPDTATVVGHTTTGAGPQDWTVYLTYRDTRWLLTATQDAS